MPIHDYDTYHDLDRLKQIVDQNNPAQSEELMKALFPLRKKKIGTVLQDIITRFQDSSDYDTPMKWFTPTEFNTFMDFFKRKLTKEKKEEIGLKTNQFNMTMPAEANIESIGDFTDTSSILRLKKPTKDVIKDLTSSGISNVEQMEYISFKLLKSYYHRVHCPVDGTLQKITFIGTEEPLFGSNSLWIVEFNSNFGRVFMLVVGELSIQDFKFSIKEGDPVKKFDELGNFNWGSQVVVIFEKDYFTSNILIQEKEKYFVGDGIFANVKIIDPTAWDELPTQFTRNADGSDFLRAPTGSGIF